MVISISLLICVCSVTVGATDIDDKKASFSNQGECVDVFAPVRKIIVTCTGQCMFIDTISRQDVSQRNC